MYKILLCCALFIGTIIASGSFAMTVIEYPIGGSDPTHNNFATAMAVDTSGNIYVTGISEGSGTNGDYATIKYDSSGNQQWMTMYNGPKNMSDSAAAIVVDASGNVYVTGTSYGGTGTAYDFNYDYATVKYDSSGNELWVRRYDGSLGNSMVQRRRLPWMPRAMSM